MHARRLYAHRGASAECPENTLPAFQRALDLGCDALEMDVHLTRDNHLLVVHDELATRTTGAALAWNTVDLAAAQRLDAGWGFLAADGTRPFAGQGIYAPTFTEVLDAYPDVHINVDIKGERAVEVMLALLREHDAERRVTLASFQTKTLVDVRRKKYQGETGLAQGEVAALLALPSIVWRQLPWTGNAAQVPTHQGPLRFDRAPFIAKCHSVGLRVDYWVIDDATEAARLLELGADGIMTNDPAKIAPLFH
ncbi:MAG TPA: glycerophosphodiester phosphodiesterase family protein [Kofleriaceae bacterium]|nr:glycerophosphodiester phosphodiesterase family protein [Kofleriaceae bacterium]